MKSRPLTFGSDTNGPCLPSRESVATPADHPAPREMACAVAMHRWIGLDTTLPGSLSEISSPSRSASLIPCSVSRTSSPKEPTGISSRWAWRSTRAVSHSRGTTPSSNSNDAASRPFTRGWPR